THRLLKPWRVRGEWFKASPFLAGIAIEAVRDDCALRRAFIELKAKEYAARSDPAKEIAIDEQLERDFPDLYLRFGTPKNATKSIGGRTIYLPPTKYTRLIVEGFPEVTWGAPKMSPREAAIQKIRKEIEERSKRRAERNRSRTQ